MRSAIVAKLGYALFSASLHVSAPCWALGERASADVKGRDGRELGKLKLVETNAGVLIHLRLKGMSPGPHAVHLHEIGKCENDFESAGGIFNPLGNKHGFLSEEGPMAGDLPNVIASAAGEVDVEFLAPFVTLSKDSDDTLMDADGTAIVVHERADDYLTDPSGNSGARFACGVITPPK